jgi:hypothetical protein
MDTKAKKILINTFWTNSGWRDEKITDTKDFEYAKSKGVMFEKITIDHEELGEKLSKVYDKIDKQQVVEFFIASLTSRKLEYRSFLSSFAIARVFKTHKFQSNDYKICKNCGTYNKGKTEYDLNVLNFEKIKWGGVRFSSIEYVLFDLEQIKKITNVKPTKEDYEILEDIKNVIINLPQEERPRQLEKRLSKVFKSNINERENILNILGICGILETEDQKGFYSNFIPYNEREDRPVNKTDWSYPVDWWQGKFGINKEVWNYYFG